MITVDSGAAESVTSEQNFPEIPTRPSARSRGGVEHENANGSTMPNRGEKLVPVKIRGERSLRSETPGD